MIRAMLLAVMLATPAVAQMIPETIDKVASIDPGESSIPEGWIRHEAFGLTFAVPADWKVMRESEDAYVLAAPGFAPREQKGLGLGIQLLDADYFITDFLENPTFSALLDAEKRPPLPVASGIEFDRFTGLPEQTGADYATEGAVSRYRHAQDGHLLLNFIAFDPARLAENTPLIERVFSTFRLSAPAQFKAETILVSEGAAAPGEAAATLGGLVTVRPPNGWRLKPGEQEVTLRTETVFSAVITLRRGKAARDALSLDDLFQGEPDVSTGRIFGQSARIFSGPAAYAGMQSGTRLEQGEVRVYLLEQCLPNGAPVMIETVAAPGWLQDHDLQPVMAAIEADWPTGMRPCHPAVTARATWALEEVLAFVLPEGFESGRSRSSFWIRTTTDPHAAVSVGTGSDSFPADFQLAASNSQGNGFIAAPEMRQVTIMGEPATLFVGRSQAGEGSRVQHVALLDRCLPDDMPLVVDLRADDAWLNANEGFEALLNNVWIFLPEGTQPCDPALLQTAVEVSGAAAAQGIDPAEGGARGVTAGTDSTLPEPGDGGTDGLAGAVSPVLHGDMSNWSVTAAEFEASAAEITAKPGGDGVTSYYVAPALARGDWSHVRALRLDKKSHGGSYYADGYGSEGDIILEGPAGRAVYPLPKHHSGEWRSFEITLDDPGWSLSQGADNLADVLSSVTALRIRAEYGAGTDHSGLRNVSLVVSNKVAPANTAEQLRAAGLQSMLDGDYETALDRLERSLALKHDEALAGRVERLRLFLNVRSDSDPTNEGRGE